MKEGRKEGRREGEGREGEREPDKRACKSGSLIYKPKVGAKLY